MIEKIGERTSDLLTRYHKALENEQRWQAVCEDMEKNFIKAIEYVQSWYPEDIFPETGQSLDCKSAMMARLTCKNIKDKYFELMKDVYE